MYAAVPGSGDFSKPGNLDLFDASGLAKFLSTEIVIETGKDPLRTIRDKGIDTIVKYQIRVLNNKSSSDVNVQAEFAKFARFDDGSVLPATDAEIFARSRAHSLGEGPVEKDCMLLHVKLTLANKLIVALTALCHVLVGAAVQSGNE